MPVWWQQTSFKALLLLSVRPVPYNTRVPCVAHVTGSNITVVYIFLAFYGWLRLISRCFMKQSITTAVNMQLTRTSVTGEKKRISLFAIKKTTEYLIPSYFATTKYRSGGQSMATAHGVRRQGILRRPRACCITRLLYGKKVTVRLH